MSITPVYEKDLSSSLCHIDTIQLNEYTGNTIYSGITLLFNFTGFTSHFDTEEHMYSNIILNNDVYIYTGLTDETHYFVIYNFYSGGTPSIDPLLTGLTEANIISGFTTDIISCSDLLSGYTGTCCPVESVLSNLPWVYQTDHGSGTDNCSRYIQRRPERGFMLDYVFNRNGLPWTDTVFFYEGVRDEYDPANYLDNNLSFAFTSDGRIKWTSYRYTGYCDTISGYTDSYYISTGQTLPLCTNGTSDDFNITITFERYYEYSGCSLANEGGWNDLIHTGLTSTSGSTIVTGETIEQLSSIWLKERKSRLGKLKFYLNGRPIEIDDVHSSIRNFRNAPVYHFKDWEEIILSDRGFQPFTHAIGGGVTGSGNLHNSICCYSIKYAAYFEDYMNAFDIRYRYLTTIKPYFDITECYDPCTDDLYNIIPSQTPTITPTITPTSTVTPTPTVTPTVTPTPSFSWDYFWSQNYISDLSVIRTSDTGATITATIVGSDYDEVYFERSTDTEEYIVEGSSLNETYYSTGLTTSVYYVWRARLYKNGHYGTYSFPVSPITRTVGGNGDYPTLKSAIDDINNGTLNTGIITLQIISGTTETSQIILAGSQMFSQPSQYSKIYIYPTGSNYSISGNISGNALISLSGLTDNTKGSVIIDGRVNGYGTAADLIITNTSTSSSSGTSTIRFIMGSSENTIKYCNLKGSSTSTPGGILLFSTSIGIESAHGNNNNIIKYNNITNATNRPVNTIYSTGTSGKVNTNNVIENNNIFDFWNPSLSSYCIYVGGNSSAWVISGNSIFETTNFVSTAAVVDIIRINHGSGNDFVVSNNYIGGNSPMANGTWMISSACSDFNVIRMNCQNDNRIDGNIITNINYTDTYSSNISCWTAIKIDAGIVRIGLISGNTIGAYSGNTSISIESNNGVEFYGINVFGSSTSYIENNIMGSIYINTYGSGINGDKVTLINHDGTLGAIYVYNNILGGISPNSIRYNTINNNSAIYGINITSQISYISGNTIDNLSLYNELGGSIYGISDSSSLTRYIFNNFIHNISGYDNSINYVSGIEIIGYSAEYYCWNNIIVLNNTNANASIFGIKRVGGNPADSGYIYYNTVYIGGTVPLYSTSESYCLNYSEEDSYSEIYNNILFNARTNNGGDGTHYSIFLPSVIDNTTIDYNNYYVSGIGGILGSFEGVPITTLELWKGATGQDNNSLNLNPVFVNEGGINAINYIPTITSLLGLELFSVINDFGSNARIVPVTMGAWEI